MKRIIILTAKILGGIVAFVVVLLVAAFFIFNSSRFQQRMLDYSRGLLEEKLQTKVEVDSVSLDLMRFHTRLHGLRVEDRQHRPMLNADYLAVNLDLPGILSKQIKVTYARLEGVKARLYKPEGEEPNYQFVIDAFKSDKKKEDAPKKKQSKLPKLTFEVSDAAIGDIDVVFNEDTFALERLTYDRSWTGSHEGKIRNLRGKMDMRTKKGPQTARLEIPELTLKGKDMQQMLTLSNIHFSIDNHLPRKNADKPKRGFFDPGHLDIKAHAELLLNYFDQKKDSINFQLTRFVADDSVTGFHIKDLRLRAAVSKGVAHVSQITFQHDSTVLRFDSAIVQLPSKKLGRKFRFETSRIQGRAYLCDIARPFAPVLQKFKMPLDLSLLFSGNDSSLVFRDVEVHTPDKRLTINADGGIDGLKVKEKLNVHFHVSQLTAKGKIKQEIISQFAGKKLMMKQLDALGDLHYTGDFRVIYKREEFEGLVKTAAGSLNFDFSLDENTKYLEGNVLTKQFKLGQVLNMKDIKDVGVKAHFKIDIHKERTAQARKKYGGKLPIGTVDADVLDVGYKGIRTHDLIVHIKSNGGQVNGDISQKKKLLDWDCEFSFTDIDKLSNIKVKPKVKMKLGNLFKKKKK